MSRPEPPNFRIPGARTSTVKSGDVTLSVAELGDRSRPSIVLVHGYPDTKEVWRDVAPLLADRFHVVAYDVRGAGDSDKPRNVADYDLRLLERDLIAVLDATCGEGPVHLVGHDWGSIQCWELVTDRIEQHRLASYTGISGPCLDHVGMLIRHYLGSRSVAEYLEFAGQLRRSWYIGVLATPGLARRAWNGPMAGRFAGELERDEGISATTHPLAPTLASDGIHGAMLYERNMPARLRHPRHDAFTRVPVQIIQPTRDRFVGPNLFKGLEKWVAHLERSTVDAGHWCVRTQPATIAALIRAHAENAASIHPGDAA